MGFSLFSDTPRWSNPPDFSWNPWGFQEPRRDEGTALRRLWPGGRLPVLLGPKKKWEWVQTSRLHELCKNRRLIWVCLKMLGTPLYPMVLLIIIPMKNGYFIGNIHYFQTNPYLFFFPKIGSLSGKPWSTLWFLQANMGFQGAKVGLEAQVWLVEI